MLDGWEGVLVGFAKYGGDSEGAVGSMCYIWTGSWLEDSQILHLVKEFGAFLDEFLSRGVGFEIDVFAGAAVVAHPS